MTDTRIDDLLDEYVPTFEPRPDGWDDVLARAHTTRRRYVARGRGARAAARPPRRRAAGTDRRPVPGNARAACRLDQLRGGQQGRGHGTQKGFGDQFPHADVSQAHGVIEIQTADGPQDLWVAPNDQGGTCWFIDWANDPVGPEVSSTGSAAATRLRRRRRTSTGAVAGYIRIPTSRPSGNTSSSRPRVWTSGSSTARRSRCQSSRAASSARCRRARRSNGSPRTTTLPMLWRPRPAQVKERSRVRERPCRQS